MARWIVVFACVLPWVAEPAAAAPPLRCASRHNGPCRAADTFDVLFDAQKQPMLVMNFGLLLPTGAGSATVCEEAFGGRTPEQLAVTPSGQVLIPAREGVFRGSEGNPCHWTLARGLPADTFVQQVVADPAAPARVWALVGAGNARSLYISEDEGATFALRHAFPSGQVWWRLLVVPGNPGRIYLGGPGAIGPFALAVSEDDGASFVVTDPIADLSESGRTTILLGASSATPPRLFFARDSAQGGDEIWMSKDGGKLVAKALALPPGHIVGGFAFGVTSDTVWVASRALLLSGRAEDASLHVSHAGGDSWQALPQTAPTGPRFRCLHHVDGMLYACGGGVDAADAFYLGRSVDGLTWEPVLTKANLNAPPTCLRQTCLETSAWLCDTYAACAPSATDAGATDAGVAVSSAGCGCRLGASRLPETTPWAVGAIAFAALTFGRRRLGLRKLRS